MVFLHGPVAVPAVVALEIYVVHAIQMSNISRLIKKIFFKELSRTWNTFFFWCVFVMGC